jgi:hypothetical protein
LIARDDVRNGVGDVLGPQSFEGPAMPPSIEIWMQ